MANLFKIFVKYAVDGPSEVYKVDDITDTSIEKDKEGRYIQNLKFNVHKATEEELEEYEETKWK